MWHADNIVLLCDIVSEATSQLFYTDSFPEEFSYLPVLVPLGIWPFGLGGGLSVVARQVEQIKNIDTNCYTSILVAKWAKIEIQAK